MAIIHTCSLYAGNAHRYTSAFDLVTQIGHTPSLRARVCLAPEDIRRIESSIGMPSNIELLTAEEYTHEGYGDWSPEGIASLLATRVTETRQMGKSQFMMAADAVVVSQLIGPAALEQVEVAFSHVHDDLPVLLCCFYPVSDKCLSHLGRANHELFGRSELGLGA